MHLSPPGDGERHNTTHDRRKECTMRQPITLFLLITLPTVLFFAISKAQDANSTTPDETASAKARGVIVPLVTLKPGETKELLFSTWCTVGATRAGGFSLAEMSNGTPTFENSTLKGNRLFSKRGVTITVPGFAASTKFAGSAEFAPLKKLNIDAFKVTLAASPDAQPGILEMHLVDATCGGYCKTDFRVLVVEP